MFGSKWKNALDVLSLRISNLSLDLSCLQGNYNRRELWLVECLDALNRRIDKLEKDNKKLQQLLQCNDKGLVITVTNCNKS